MAWGDGFALVSSLVLLFLMAWATGMTFQQGQMLRGKGEEHRTLLLEKQELLQVLEKVLNSLQSDPTPLSDSWRDPVWTEISILEHQGWDIQLKDVSSALNINALSKDVLSHSLLQSHFLTSLAPEEIHSYQKAQGFYQSLDEVSHLFDFSKGFFTIYGYWNPCFAHPIQLQRLIESRSGEDGENLAIALKSSPSQISALLGEDDHGLNSLIFHHSPVNVHFAQPELLSLLVEMMLEKGESSHALLDSLNHIRLLGFGGLEEWKEEFANHQKQDLSPALLGTETWFWSLSLSSPSMKLSAVITKGWGGEEDRFYHVLSCVFEKLTNEESRRTRSSRRCGALLSLRVDRGRIFL